MPAISVIIPCYNYGRFVEEAVDSVLASTFQDFEIVIVNDGSTDAFTNELLAKLDKPKTRVLWQSNCGLPCARNNGIRSTDSPYFLPLDADEKLLLHIWKKPFGWRKLIPKSPLFILGCSFLATVLFYGKPMDLIWIFY